MSGHSKWSTIKRKKGATDAKRGKIFTKIAREITFAAGQGTDPDTNFKLRLALDRARTNNMPKDNIERAVRRGAGLGKDGAALAEVVYEGYGPHGIAYLIEVVTDNRNRALSEIRRHFTRAGGSLAEAGSVAWQFDTKGLIVIPLDGLDAEAILDMAIEAGAEDVGIGDEAVEIYTAPDQLKEVQDALQQLGLTTESAELVQEPKTRLSLGPRETVQTLHLIEQLEDLEDVSRIFTNLEFSDEALAEYEMA